MVYSCATHAEEAIEEALTDEGLPPDLERLPEDKTVLEKCFICNEQAVYQVISQEL
ncbi:CxxH/CxxC protein [Salipaludibacillus sp. CUR1]|uniref:CxxH/CxxC protein n=1 Tax=Salipaludibacillus sp. CUR1 TaxID=2820003 RepID=UPI001E3DF400|nr:CxxH/CxxC protein [Salipaludibacillus sp. CUR1]MCE7790875.1 CxxH/CxxC protein [Salipaludibacillus sp. CUR1]